MASLPPKDIARNSGGVMDDDRYNELIELIYDAALNPVHWDAVIQRMREEFHSIAAGFFVQTADQRLDGSYVLGMDNSEMERYGQHFAQNNPWFTTPGLMMPGRVLTDRSLEVLHNDPTAFLKTEMYQDWCRAQDFRHAMGGSLLDSDGNKLNFTFFRAATDGHYSDNEISRYQALSRHLIRAVEVNCRLSAEIDTNGSQYRCFDLFRLGVILLNQQGRIVYTNKSAMALISERSGLYEKASRLHSIHPDYQARLDRLIDSACHDRKSGQLTLPKKVGTRLSLCIVPQSEQRSLIPAATAATILIISDHDDRPILQIPFLIERWGLSPTEARFAALMAQGLSIIEIADELQLTENTARWYSKQIIQKLGVKRQAEVVMKLMNDFSVFLKINGE